MPSRILDLQPRGNVNTWCVCLLRRAARVCFAGPDGFYGFAIERRCVQSNPSTPPPAAHLALHPLRSGPHHPPHPPPRAPMPPPLAPPPQAERGRRAFFGACGHSAGHPGTSLLPSPRCLALRCACQHACLGPREGGGVGVSFQKGKCRDYGLGPRFSTWQNAYTRTGPWAAFPRRVANTV